MVKINKKITSLIWISPVVAAIALSTANCNKKSDDPAPEATPQQVAPPTPTPTPAATATGPTAKEVVDRMNAVTITIVDGDKLAASVKDGSLTVSFKLAEGTSAEGLSFQCKAGKMPAVMDAAYGACTSATSHAITNLTEAATYRFFVKAVDTTSGASSKEFTGTIDLSNSQQSSAEYVTATVGNVWNVTMNPNMYISEVATSNTADGRINLTEEVSSGSALYNGVNTAGSGGQMSTFSQKDGTGIVHNYQTVQITQNADFQSMTDHRMSRNSVTFTRPMASVFTPGANSYGTLGFERMIVNVYDSPSLNATGNTSSNQCYKNVDADFQTVRDLFVRLCGKGNFSSWVGFPAFTDMTTAKLASAVRTCTANIDFGMIGSPSQRIIIAQALQYDPQSYGVQTEVVYMLQLGAYGVVSQDQIVGTLAKLVQNNFQPVKILSR